MLYLDYSANTPVDEAVLQCFCDAERRYPGNANAHHQAGAAAKAAINEATRSIARCLGAPPAGIIYTSGASEANNLAVKGLAALGGAAGRHILSTPLEHSSVSGSLEALQKQGYEVELLDILPDGTVDLADQMCIRDSFTVGGAITMAKCECCGKGVTFGIKVSHSDVYKRQMPSSVVMGLPIMVLESTIW